MCAGRLRGVRPRVERLLVPLHRATENEDLTGPAAADAVVGGIDPVNRADIDAIGPAPVLNGELLRETDFVSFGLEQLLVEGQILAGGLADQAR